MKIRRSASGAPDKVELQMTPMIDIVFQLISFFVFTFRIATPEGDFTVKMPVAAASAAQAELDNLPIRIRLAANPDGTLARIEMGDRVLPSFAALRSQIVSTVGRDTGPDSAAAKSEVELDCDYNLRYENAMRAIDSVAGYIGPNGEIIKMVQKIKFSPPKKPK